MTDAQIFALYGRERDEKTGALKPVGVERKRPYTTPQELEEDFLKTLISFGVNPNVAKEKYDKARTKGV